MIEWIENFITMNPWETVFVMSTVFTFFGMYIEDVFKIWDWGPKCDACRDYHFYDDCIILCKQCDEYRCNDEWQAGIDRSRKMEE